LRIQVAVTLFAAFWAFSLWNLAQKLGGVGLIAVGLVDSSFIPTFGSLDALAIVLAIGKHELWWYYALMATVGSVIGGYVTYRIARKGGKEGLERRFGRDKLQRIYDAYGRWGFGAVFVPAVLPPPFPTSPFLVSAGALDFPIRKYMVALTTARTIRYFALCFIGARYGRGILHFFSRHHVALLVTFSVLAIGAGLVIGWYIWKRRKHGPRSQAAPKERWAA
jgi:membrane protein YqaA with SNARE-associated domain